MQLTKLLMIVCVFGLLMGAKRVNESLIVLRAAELVHRQDKTAAAPDPGKSSSLGEALLAVLFGVAGLADPGVVDAVAQAAKADMLKGCAWALASLLALGLVAILHFRPRGRSALESARRRRRGRCP